MLTTALVRLAVQGKVVAPRWVRPDAPRDLERAERLIGIVREHVGGTLGALEEALKAATGEGRDFRLQRGLAKLLLDRTQMEPPTSLEPPVVRELVFELAAARHPLDAASRAAVLEEAGRRLEAPPEEVERALYADLAASQRVVAFEDLSPAALLHRYNVALAQAVLLRARDVRVTLEDPEPRRLRQLLRALKFHRLMFRAERPREGLALLRIDGPLDLLKSTGRYGVHLAQFLPTLLLGERWRLECEVQVTPGGPRATFSLDPSAGLQSHARDTGTWVAPEEEAFAARLQAVGAPWTVEPCDLLLDLDGRDALVPDLTVRDPETGRRAWIDVVWRWRRSALARRWDLLREVGPPNLVVCVCGAEESVPDLPGPVHAFKALPNARTVMSLVREVAR